VRRVLRGPLFGRADNPVATPNAFTKENTMHAHKIHSTGSVGCGGQSSRTQLLFQAANISAAKDRGEDGFWPAKPLELIDFAATLAPSVNNTTTQLLQRALTVSRDKDNGIDILAMAAVDSVYQKAQQLVG
jgi:hypothetical protein